MARAGLRAAAPGADARQRIAGWPPGPRELLPIIEAEWAATDAAELEAELCDRYCFPDPWACWLRRRWRQPR